MRRDPSALIEKAPARLGFDYVLATIATAMFVLVLWRLGFLAPLADAATRRVAYSITAAGGLGLAWAVYTWINATYSDNSARMIKVRARQGRAIRTVRYHLLAESLLLSAVSVGAILVDVESTWRMYVFYVWGAALLAAAVGLWRVLRLQWRLNELREIDDRATDRPPAEAFTWRRSG
jgi:hypothetical protein